MFKLGCMQKLKIVKTVDFGVYLAQEEENENRVLLPKKQVPQGANLGDEIQVFIYKDSKDRIISTTNTPKIMLGETAVLEVIETGKIGAFLDWGMEKDLLLPFKEQTVPVKAGDQVLVALYVDKSERLCATTKVYDYLSLASPYDKDDMVRGRVYEVSKEFGIYVAVDDKYQGRISPEQFENNVKYGDIIEARVTERKQDGKLDLSMRQKAYLQMDEDARNIMELIMSKGGRLGFNDKADKEIIKDVTGLSKNAFKRAVGKLYKERKVDITPDDILATSIMRF
ncbi:hypothetical protein SAMN05216249_10669 [Acetitomaculum ruminis DSM 5522]|uniref:S1 motif domain-containing protein n=1 Tax=Acetitomaculum ruminis DSM 5522 TaxID=1120918 RepID=A0A1I0XBL2_9FIRM|nr:S1-like domain-containing RNA-binding protein [Acetitomaculum ruminis]SFA98264.1 hypothetical protein SAMN05216249_10669 [Acetitomaculum ruminis DSM 5522]